MKHVVIMKKRAGTRMQRRHVGQQLAHQSHLQGRGRIHQLITEGHFGDNAQRLGRDWVILNSPNPFEFMLKKEVAKPYSVV